MKKLTGDALNGALKNFQDKPVKAQAIKTRAGWPKRLAVTVAAVAIMATAGLGLVGCGDNGQQANAPRESAPIVMQHEAPAPVVQDEGHRNSITPKITVYPDAKIVVEGVYKGGADHEEIYHFDGSRIHQSTTDDEMTYSNLRNDRDQARVNMYRTILEQGGAPANAPEDLPEVVTGDSNYHIEILPNSQVVAEHFTINGVEGSRIWFFDNSDIVVNTFGDEAGISRISATDAKNYRSLQNQLRSGGANDTVTITADQASQSVSKNIILEGKTMSLTWEFASSTRASGQLSFTIDGNSNSVPISTARSGFSKQMRNHLTKPAQQEAKTFNPASRLPSGMKR